MRPTVIYAILPIACIAAFGATFGHAPSGVFERLASTGGFPFGLAILGRLTEPRLKSPSARTG